MAVGLPERKWGEEEEGKGGQLYGDEERLDSGSRAHNAINLQMMCCRTVHLTHILLTVTPINLIN